MFSRFSFSFFFPDRTSIASRGGRKIRNLTVTFDKFAKSRSRGNRESRNQRKTSQKKSARTAQSTHGTNRTGRAPARRRRANAAEEERRDETATPGDPQRDAQRRAASGWVTCRSSSRDPWFLEQNLCLPIFGRIIADFRDSAIEVLF